MKAFKIWLNKYRYKIIAGVFWIILWQALSLYINNKIFLASPINVLKSLFSLCQTKDFWLTIASTSIKIASGFFLAVIGGIILSVVVYRYTQLKEITTVFMQTIKSIPVASFVILALLWVEAKNLSLLISFLMVLPIIYTNVMKGIQATDVSLLQMAKVFRIPKLRKVRYIYLPEVTPYFVSACSVGLGFCWKSGIAAEVISLARYSIGRRLYEAKLYLSTEELFAWTIVIVIVSALFEKLVMIMIRFFSRNITRSFRRSS